MKSHMAESITQVTILSSTNQVVLPLERYKALIETEKKLKALLDYSSGQAYPLQITNCGHEGCTAFEVGDGARSDSSYIGCQGMEDCEYCSWYSRCDKHLSDLIEHDDNYYYSCPDCNIKLQAKK